MRIAILEKTDFNEVQMTRLKALGSVEQFDSLTQEQANTIAPQYDAVVVNWLDPTPFLTQMKKGSLVSLLSTGYGWITNLKEAAEKGVYVTNIPGYSTEAVAEHLLGLLLGVSKNIFSTLNACANETKGFELKGKTVGIIGLGNIGTRFAEIMDFFGAKVITYNRSIKGNKLAKDVSLDELMMQSDIVCISCSVNEQSRSLINESNITKLKEGVVIIGSTWDIITEKAIQQGLASGVIAYIAFDAAVEGSEKLSDVYGDISNRFFITPHIAYDTFESENRQLDICVENIERFFGNNPQNVINGR